ncbi:methyltransferase domain-containing protein [Pseudoalteromonas sp. J010]|uniref:tRNA1(Val) (adenine(37)-N6)-methyltransferase n=1 Tax=Pseudoalteromonas TaxID=53246 RepID=UPI000F64D8AE|nr:MULTISPECIES: methyltransferase [Pseudoalteromonas]MDW7547656.1 methyltransferase [Pseudoalteromonas peptidolytica]RRS10112.1 methyltransferase domain-containing protein [Pseudoalteromonas sp. J010]
MSQFAFKQFSVTQRHAAMKVSTDGILLGAWAPVSNARSIVDVGAGTGLVALMCKQRNPNSSIYAVELDQAALVDAQYNITHSPWPDIKLCDTAIQAFECETQFDLMVSNPPYFNTSLKSQDPARNRARHTDSLSFDDLLSAFERLTSPLGQLAVILPYQESLLFNQLADKRNLSLISACTISTTPKKAPSRRLMLFSKLAHHTKDEQRLVIYDENNQYSKEYVALCQAFYLKM